MNDGLNVTQKKERQSFGTSGHEEKNRVSRMVPRIGMTIDETADYTGIGRTTLRQLIRSGKIPTLKIGRKTIIRVDTMEYFLKINEGLNLLDNDEVRAVK